MYGPLPDFQGRHQMRRKTPSFCGQRKIILKRMKARNSQSYCCVSSFWCWEPWINTVRHRIWIALLSTSYWAKCLHRTKSISPYVFFSRNKTLGVCKTECRFQILSYPWVQAPCQGKGRGSWFIHCVEDLWGNFATGQPGCELLQGRGRNMKAQKEKWMRSLTELSFPIPR